MYKHYIGKFEVTDFTSTQYLHVATNTSGSHCLKNNIIFTLHADDVPLRCREIVKTHKKRVNSLNHAFIERAVGVMAPMSTCLRSCWRQAFRA